MRHEVWAGGIDRPLGFDFIGPDEVLVFENRTGRVLHVLDGQILGEVLDLRVGNRGGLGLVVSPGFATDGLVFLHYTTPLNGMDGGVWNGTRIERRRFDGQSLVEPLLLLEVPFDATQVNGTNHDSGTLRIGPDGKLYGQLGDKHRGRFSNPRQEQNTGAESARCGAIFRLELDGSIPQDNPFANHPEVFLRPWFVTGFRNSLGMAFDAQTGSLWFTDNGSTSYDELNRAVPGMNAGWLLLMGPDGRDATYIENGSSAFDAADLVLLPGATYRDPEFSWATCIGVTGVQFLPERRFPEDLWGDLWVADFQGNLSQFAMSPDRLSVELPALLDDGVADGSIERESLWMGTGFGTVTEMRTGPDGYIYLADYYGGHLRRIRPQVDIVEPSQASITAGTLAGEGLVALERADGLEFVLTDPVIIDRARGELALELEFSLNDTTALDLDIELETRTSLSTARMEIYLYRPSTGTWERIDDVVVGSTPSHLSLATPAPASQWVDPSTRKVQLRLRLRGLLGQAAQAVGGTSITPAREWGIDLARLQARLP